MTPDAFVQGKTLMNDVQRTQGEITLDENEGLSPRSHFESNNALRSIRKCSCSRRPSATHQSAHHPNVLSPKRRRRVAFGVVQLNYHPIALGDNPGVTTGPPLTIEWIPIHSQQTTVENFENAKACALNRRHGKQLKLSRVDRVNMLSVQGYSRNEMNRAEREVNMIKASRKAARQPRLGETVPFKIGLFMDAESRLCRVPTLADPNPPARNDNEHESMLPLVMRLFMAKAA